MYLNSRAIIRFSPRIRRSRAYMVRSQEKSDLDTYIGSVRRTVGKVVLYTKERFEKFTVINGGEVLSQYRSGVGSAPAGDSVKSEVLGR
jgi:hypothetical protein